MKLEKFQNFEADSQAGWADLELAIQHLLPPPPVFSITDVHYLIQSCYTILEEEPKTPYTLGLSINYALDPFFGLLVFVCLFLRQVFSM